MQDNSLVNSRLRQFEIKNGDDGIVIGNWVYFSNGAMREQNPYGPLLDPPADAVKRLQNVFRYREELLRRARQDFDRFKNQLTLRAQEATRWASANAPPPPPGEQELAQLKTLQAAVKKDQREFDKARKALDAVLPTNDRERHDRALKNQQQAAEALKALNEIQV